MRLQHLFSVFSLEAKLSLLLIPKQICISIEVSLAIWRRVRLLTICRSPHIPLRRRKADPVAETDMSVPYNIPSLTAEPCLHILSFHRPRSPHIPRMTEEPHAKYC